jgi:hypothetical protein
MGSRRSTNLGVGEIWVWTWLCQLANGMTLGKLWSLVVFLCSVAFSFCCMRWLAVPSPRWLYKPKVPGTQKILNLFERQPFPVFSPFLLIRRRLMVYLGLWVWVRNTHSLKMLRHFPDDWIWGFQPRLKSFSEKQLWLHYFILLCCSKHLNHQLPPKLAVCFKKQFLW